MTNQGNVSPDGSDKEKEEFKLPKWKKIKGEEHICSNSDLSFDLLAIEEFVNNMLALGWRPVSTNGGSQFSFVACAPGEFICRTVLTIAKQGGFDKTRAAELTALLTADGAEIIPQKSSMGSRIGLIAIRPAALGPFEITSDLDSKIAEYEARRKFGQSLGVVFLIIGFSQFALMYTSTAFVGSAFVWFMIGFFFYRPVPRYNEILKRLRAERDIQEV